jgi:O-antigen/teichoic acid export membrane protein
MSWLMVSTMSSRVVTFLAQILLGWWLLPSEFALYSTAISISGFLMVCRDMATGTVLVQRGREGYERSAGAAFWMGFWYNCVVTIITFGAAWPLAQYVYQKPQLVPMLIIMALGLPFSAISNTLFALLRLEMRFFAFSMQSAMSSLVRQIVVLALAYWGAGPMAFAWSILAYMVFDAASLMVITKECPWKRPPQLEEWPRMAKDSGWLMATSLAHFAMDFGPFLILVPLLRYTLGNAQAAEDITGYYFFAYQITAQIGVMLAFNASMILTPALQRLVNQPQRQREAALRSLRSLMLAGSITSLGLASVMEPLEHLLWRGKFSDSVAAVLVLGIFYPWRITFGLCTSVLLARGAFRRLAVLSVFECVGLIIAAGLAAFFHPTPHGIAWWTGGWVLLSRLVSTLYIFYRMDGGIAGTLRSMVPAWGLAVLAFLGARGAGSLLAIRERVSESEWLATSFARFLSPQRTETALSILADIAAIAFLGGVCLALFMIATRLFLREDMTDVLRVAPSRVRRIAQRLLRIRCDQ